jgi:hypothetical protein
MSHQIRKYTSKNYLPDKIFASLSYFCSQHCFFCTLYNARTCLHPVGRRRAGGADRLFAVRAKV